MALRRNLDAGQFVILSEMEPPKGVDVSTFVNNALKVKGAVDAFLVPEMNNAVMRISALGGGMLLESKGMETVMQICCRDRNRLALQADLLAAYASGITSIMAVAGEDPSLGDHHEAKAVYDIDELELLNGVETLNQGRDMAGVELQGAPNFLVGAAVGAASSDKTIEQEVKEMTVKIEAGARFFVTPPVFDLDRVTELTRSINRDDVKIIPTVLLLKSIGMARYISRNVSHIHLPDETLERIQKAGDRVRECVTIARETINLLKDNGFPGVLISTLGWEHKLPEVLGGMGV